MSPNAAKETRFALVWIGLISGAALGLLVWLIYLREPGRSATESVAFLPALNAGLNSLSALALTAGFYFIRRSQLYKHRIAMMAAFVFSSLFLGSYIIYHSYHGDTRFLGQGLVRPVYFSILITHILLSAVALPLVLTTFFFSLSGRLPQHRRIARWTFPIWMIVSVTGVAIFWLLRAHSGAH
ncbi:MAG: DUF420 domain-containing protein [Armatimonadetes bacterium]|nr:DUF420 domain-containing protein [Armatimonadota bacterium]